ncbi:mobilization protein [Ornithobacterium rhinotracheale]|uniref:relaxase/mobilization nuclease domain-containing protein n=1 Tax=Ornithobacterium rhinotracheale TaxID=28251 RepID=UPI00129CF7D0|nr:relaxase/mobilization nuclease domain-containing protein [Ornithobacterium rhinotracheale]MRI64246.1 mobilization protein [Ornithobacterium rhinotracheale]
MIVKLLSSASADFHGVQYNDKKVKNEKGELMQMKNFPSFINSESSKEQVRDYLKSISKSNKVKKPQFHAVISTKFQEHSKEELTKVAEDFMQEMGYGKQPYIVVFHKDTDNNHVHIVSTRVDKDTGKKINDSFEKLKSQRALNHAMEKNFGVKPSAELNKLLAYEFSTFSQLEMLLRRSGFKVVASKHDNEAFDILRNGLKEMTLKANEVSFSAQVKDKRSRQLKAILEKYKNNYSNKVFKVIDDRAEKGLKDNPNAEEKAEKTKFEYESELQEKLREMFGIDIVFHFKDDKQPFGYTLIDHTTQKVYKGSDIMKMKDLFDFTQDSINKRDFEQIKDYNLRGEKDRAVLLSFLQQKNPNIKDFMLFRSKKENNKNVFEKTKDEVREYVRKPKAEIPISIIEDEEGKKYVIHEQYHQIHELSYLIGEKAYQEYMGGMLGENNKNTKQSSQSESLNIISDVMKELSKSAYVGRDRTEDEFKKRKRKKRR